MENTFAGLQNIFAVVGMLNTAVLIFLVSQRIVRWSRGITPALYRLGDGLANRKVAIFAKGDNLESLKSLLDHSGLFREGQVLGISKLDDIDIAHRTSVYLAYWPDWADSIDDILREKDDQVPLIVYAPRDQGFIPEEYMKKLDGKRNTAVTNFRGRLMNDIVTAMITTSSAKNYGKS
jgi:hypothetical protein